MAADDDDAMMGMLLAFESGELAAPSTPRAAKRHRHPPAVAPSEDDADELDALLALEAEAEGEAETAKAGGAVTWSKVLEAQDEAARSATIHDLLRAAGDFGAEDPGMVRGVVLAVGSLAMDAPVTADARCASRAGSVCLLVAHRGGRAEAPQLLAAVLEDDWAHTSAAPRDVVHVCEGGAAGLTFRGAVRPASDALRTAVGAAGHGGRDVQAVRVSFAWGAVVVRPDTVLSPTRVAGVQPCLRRAVLSERLGGTGAATEEMVLGRLRHALVEAGLRAAFGLDQPLPRASQLGPDAVSALVAGVVRGAAEDELAALGWSVDDAAARLADAVPAVASLCARAVANSDEHSEPGGAGGTRRPAAAASDIASYADPCGGGPDRSAATPLAAAPPSAVRGVLSTEQAVCSPKWGLAGIVDAVVTLRDERSGTAVVGPLELKTGSAAAGRGGSVRPSHRAQASMYSMLLEPPSGAAASAAAIVYLRPGGGGGGSSSSSARAVATTPAFAEHVVFRVWSETRALLQSRNALASALGDATAKAPGRLGVAAEASKRATRRLSGTPLEARPRMRQARWLRLAPTLPAIDVDDGLCERCFMLGPCSVHQAALGRRGGEPDIEDAVASPSSTPAAAQEPPAASPSAAGTGCAVSAAASELSSADAAYFARWTWLVDTEAEASTARECGLDAPWVAASRPGEDGGGFPLRVAACHPSCDAGPAGDGTGPSGSFDVLLHGGAGVSPGDWVSVALRRGATTAWGASKGRVLSREDASVRLRLLENPEAALSVAEAASQGSVHHGAGGTEGAAGPEGGATEARVDRKPLANSTRLARRNLVGLCAATGDDAKGDDGPRLARLRHVLVDGTPPAFAPPGPSCAALGIAVPEFPSAALGSAAAAGGEGLPKRAKHQSTLPFVTETAAGPKAAAAPGPPPVLPPSAEVAELRSDVAALNGEQQRGVVSILCARDACILQGMPGTGKTTVLAIAVRGCAAQGRRVLLTAFTHSAVDNAVLKAAPYLLRHGRGVLRLGAARSIHPEVAAMGVTTQRPASSAWEAITAPDADEDGELPRRAEGGAIKPSDAVPAHKGGSGSRAGAFTAASGTAPPAPRLLVAVRKASLVATTCLGVGSPLLGACGEPFDLCIVDEASQLVEPVTLGPMLLARATCLVGDHEQLPPLVVSRVASAGGMGVSLLRRLATSRAFSAPDRLSGLSPLVTLRRQYRMNAAVMRLVNILVHGRTEPDGTDAILEPEEVLLDALGPSQEAEDASERQLTEIGAAASGTAAPLSAAVRSASLEAGSWQVAARSLFLPRRTAVEARLRSDGRWAWLLPLLQQSTRVALLSTDADDGKRSSRFREATAGEGMRNDGEALAVAAAAAALVAAGARPSEVCVVAPYRAQLERVRACLGSDAFAGSLADVEVATVDRYQGRDKDVVLVSLVRSNDEGALGTLLADARRVNVMLTRAKRKLIFVGSPATLAASDAEHPMHRLEQAVREVGLVQRLGDEHAVDPALLAEALKE